MPFSQTELEELRRAKLLLEHPGLAAKLADLAGMPVEKGMKLLPSGVQKTVHKVTHKALEVALAGALRTMRKGTGRSASNRLHRIAVAASGAVGGFAGVAGLAIELPISTGIMLRSVADIAASEGHSPRDIDTKLECLVVFALGSSADKRDDASESGYFAARWALSEAVSEASKYLAKKGLVKGIAPPLVRLVNLIATRFGIVVSQKTAAQFVPVIGAAGGALINTLFIAHYQDMARGHFIVRRLEKIHGAEPVRLAYEKL
ncbi:MAG: EcsC family protein [Burkholderiales bacterium]|nr:EcsC family protein [Burkholderiales bacterium]